MAITNHAPRDDQDLPDDERKARAAGRAGSVAGALAGAAGGIVAVSAFGAVPGLSAAGISSGLAAIGSVVGGGMAAGTVAVIAIPAAAAALIGYFIYRLFRWLQVPARTFDETPGRLAPGFS